LQKEAKALDRDFFAREAEACKGLMYRVAYTILQNDADCQDAVQDALLKAWSKRNSLRDEKLFRTWLTRILINACHDLARKRRRMISLDVLPELSEEFPDLLLAEALEKLPEKFRVPLTLFYSENMTYAEIGSALRIPVTSVQSRIRRGKIQLRKEPNEMKRNWNKPNIRNAYKPVPQAFDRAVSATLQSLQTADESKQKNVLAFFVV